MLKSYDIHNFKNHADTHLDFGNLTILTGINGMGKSSVFQSMLMMRESFLRMPLMDTLSLDGESFSVGGTSELVNRNVTDDQNLLKINLSTDQGRVNLGYVYPIENANELEIANGFFVPDAKLLKSISLFNDDFQYLSAFRVGPQSTYLSQTNVVDKHRQLSGKMGMGEYSVYFLSKFGQEPIALPELAYRGLESQLSLNRQVELWMGEITDGVKLNITQNGNQYVLKYGYEQPGRPTVYHSALNTGFGLSYILSVVIAILSAKSGSLILIENPEAHIHPSGQASLMRLVSLAASQGVQIVMETHSDHIINGALVNWKKYELDRNKLAVYYFYRDENLNASPKRLLVGENGRIQNAPKGFFDQMKADLEVLFDF